MNGADAAACAASLCNWSEAWTPQKVQLLDHMITLMYSGDESQRKVAHDVLNQLKVRIAQVTLQISTQKELSQQPKPIASMRFEALSNSSKMPHTFRQSAGIG
eukprot:3945845-Amphidinium_carterae.1